jgi:AraC-like DNA-binding protein
MPIVFDFDPGERFHFASAFAERFNAQTTGERVCLPEELGQGFIQEVYPDDELSICMHRYTLKQELILRPRSSGTNQSFGSLNDTLTLKFDSARAPFGNGYQVEFVTNNFVGDLTIPAGQPISFVVIVTTRKALKKLLNIDRETTCLAKTIRENPSFVFYEGMTTEIERTLKQLYGIDETTKFPEMLYRAKAHELIWLFFDRLFSRKSTAMTPLNTADAEKIYSVRKSILADLGSPPQLALLAKNAGMSLTKMKQLFRQVFGDSIYNFYQAARMDEAASLLNHLSVSQVGYRIGFSNLSHFSRVFEKHHRMKPKRYQASLIRQ